MKWWTANVTSLSSTKLFMVSNRWGRNGMILFVIHSLISASKGLKLIQLYFACMQAMT